MSKEIEEPVTVPGRIGSDDTITSHPAFGQIGAYRQQGGSMVLYGSDFTHNHTVTIRISTSTLRRGLSRDWYSDGKEMIEVTLTESQWATFVSSMNQGSGVPCTIQHVEGKQMPSIPAIVDRTEQFSKEMLDTLGDSIKRIDEAMAKIDALGLSAKKSDDLKSSLKMAKQELVKNTPFVVGQFEEQMENTVEKAKQEIHGYMNSTLTRAGIAALSANNDILILE